MATPKPQPAKKPAVKPPRSEAKSASPAKTRLPQSLWVGLITLVVGAFVGVFVDAWVSRAKPQILVTNVEIKNQQNKQFSVEVPEEIVRMSVSSPWTRSFQGKMKIASIENNIERFERLIRDYKRFDFSATNLISIAENGGPHQTYRNIAKQLGASTLAMVTAHILGSLKRKELVIPTEFHDAIDPKDYDITTRTTNKLTSSDRRTAAIIRGHTWRPRLLVILLKHAKDTMAPQMRLISELSQKSREIITLAKTKQNTTQLHVTILVTNTGKSTISFMPYATIAISGSAEPYFLSYFKSASSITVQSGRSERLLFISATPILRTKAQELATMKYAEGQVVMRLTSKSLFSEEWVSSKKSYVFGNDNRFEKEFISKSKEIYE